MQYLDIYKLQGVLAGRSINAIYDDVAKGQLPRPVKLGNRNYWDAEEVKDHLKRLAKRQHGVRYDQPD